MKQFNMDDSSRAHELNGMTHYVTLPTRGAHYSKDHPLFGQETIEIKMLTTKEEDILTNTSYIEKEVVLDKFLESIIVNKNIKHSILHDTDQMAILIASRVEAYGEDYPIIINCQKCTEEYDHDIDLSSMLKNEIESELETTGHGTSIVELPKSQATLEFRNLLPFEAQSIEKTIERMKKNGINTSFVNEFYQRIIQSIDGNTDGEVIASFIKKMPIRDSRVLKKAYEGSIPRIDTNFQSTCNACGHENKGGLPIQASFFFPEF
tara:strand:+ start:917 stop:1708 length:792 start_codon:yes stop_codon:yes gene_type:complete